MKININKNLCIKCGLCYFKESSIFGLNEDGIAYVKTSKIKNDIKKIKNICKLCPVNAIEYE